MMSFRGDWEALVLGVLQRGPAHGYEITRHIRVTSEDAIRLGEGQLYPVLHALEQDGFIEAEWIPQPGKPPRKVYHLTEKGEGLLKRKHQEWEKFATGVRNILLPSQTQGVAHARA